MAIVLRTEHMPQQVL